MNFSVWRLESEGAEGQHGSVATRNTLMLLMKALLVQVPSQEVLHRSNREALLDADNGREFQDALRLRAQTTALK